MEGGQEPAAGAARELARSAVADSKRAVEAADRAAKAVKSIGKYADVAFEAADRAVKAAGDANKAADRAVKAARRINGMAKRANKAADRAVKAAKRSAMNGGKVLDAVYGPDGQEGAAPAGEHGAAVGRPDGGPGPAGKPSACGCDAKDAGRI